MTFFAYVLPFAVSGLGCFLAGCAVGVWAAARPFDPVNDLRESGYL